MVMTLDGLGGDDTLNGGGGNDTLLAGFGTDQFNGGEGTDTVRVSGTGVEDLVFNIDLEAGSDNYGNTYSGVENVTAGNGNDTLTGDATANILDGDHGDDTLNGGGGDDTLLAGFGTDQFNGGEGTDTVRISGTAVEDEVFNIALEAGSDNYGNTYSGVENVTAGNGNDTLTGDAAANVLDGDHGDDTLNGGGGDDTLLAGFGTDQFNGGEGADTVRVSGTAVENEVFNIDLEAGNDNYGNTYSGVENVTGGAADDTLVGDGEANVLDGHSGNDQITVSAGDTAIGGDGDDTITIDFSGAPDGSSVTIDGGDGGSDHDTINLAEGYTVVEDSYSATDDEDGNSQSGSVQVTDGENTHTVDFTEIEEPICFAEGTLIATPSGEIPVEKLQVGDVILSDKGKSVPVRWVGRQTLVKSRLAERMQPVQIDADALGHGLPHSDLTLTASHGMVLDGLIINASALVNGHSIRMVPLADLPSQYKVYHVETECHDVILANGAASETFIDYADRKTFDNYQEYLDLYGIERIVPEMSCPRISARRLVPKTIRDRLNIAEPELFARLGA
ncbi:hypothetical protein FZZ93_04340 [Halomonas eurihalina]|uniref:Hedgehog/Intein (Hint) domain-containing protein n=1 Tax=Halomonas eurihalina TaxID=42566 RepID=A0A5D9DAC1_HALER|nr:Hint domain-containing protein [Halomonas eurihalina]MDR5858514.1 Hint domain-containing protein [Halomonas eurihalina]TZG40706.1 hypothetical protein FZZ93_04340 [Halomonas eurihalina]